MTARRSSRVDDEWDVYALAAAGLPPRLRLRGRTLRVFTIGTIAVIAARPRLDSTSTEEALRAQHAVVVSLADRADPLLPARFGSRMTVERMEEIVGEAADPLSRALDHVRGRQQMTMRLFGAETGAQAEPAPTTGTAYLGRLHARALTVISSAAPLRHLVAPFVVDERLVPGRGHIRATLFHLVERANIGAYRRAVERNGLSMDPLIVGVTGPWPPFAFTPELWR